MQTNLGLYTDYLLGSFGQTSATNMARLMNDQISHDDVTRFLSQPHHIGQTLWKTVKPLFCKHQTQQGVLLVDDFIVLTIKYYTTTRSFAKLSNSTFSPAFSN